MRFLKKSAAALVLITVVAFAVATVTPQPAHGAGSAPVIVVNTSGQPVPVALQGTTTVGGTVAARQSGDWNVGLTGTPNVNVSNVPTVMIGNPASSPVLVADGGKTPARYSLDLDNTSTSNYPEVVPEVPVGKTFIVTYLTVFGFTPNPGPALTQGQCLLQLLIGNVGSFPALIPMTPNAGQFIAGSQQAFLPINAGESLGAGCSGSPFNANSLFKITIGGYFVPAP